MGAGTLTVVPQLTFEFADVKNRKLLGDAREISSLYLDLDIDSLPDYRERESRNDPFASMRTVNSAYHRELAWYTITHQLCTRFELAVRNQSSSVAHDVRVELTVALDRVLLLDEESWPELPDRSWDRLMPRHRRILLKGETEVKVKRLDDRWLLDVAVEKVQPMATAWVRGGFYAGRTETGSIHLAGTVAADNLPQPMPVNLDIHVAAERRPIDLDELLKIERQRYLASPEALRIKAELVKRAKEKAGG